MMWNKCKLKVFVAAVLAVVLTVVSQSTFAYYSTAGTATNVVTSGGIQMLIHETTDQGQPFPQKGVHIKPGDVVPKVVTVESDCETPFYLRVKMAYAVDDQDLSAADCFKLNINEAHWEWHDGWYYYKEVVNPGETTPYVFSQVEIVGDNMDNRYLGKTLVLNVNAQAVQSVNNPLTDGKTYTASGWPKE